MNKMVEITRIKKRSGFFIKNKGHCGLIMPRMKKTNVKIPMLKAAYIILLPVKLTFG